MNDLLRQETILKEKHSKKIAVLPKISQIPIYTPA
jgi:hypothetical protein